ncbi:MAG: hypothetical protein ACRD9R_17465, partial [Pyrinomonadaceae bacterium]
RELQLQLAVGAPLIATRGYAADEVREAYARARELCAQVGDRAQLFPALRGLWAFHLGRADYAEARALAEQMLELAERQQDPPLLLEAHRSLGNTMFWLGELEAARRHMERGIELYVPDEHRTLALLYGQDPDVANRGMQAWPLSLQGFPEQALRRGQESLAQARQIAHPYSLGYALVHDMCCQQYLLRTEQAEARAEQAIALATEKGFPNWLLAGFAVRGWALALRGQHDEGVGLLRQTVDLWRSTGSELVVPYFLTLLAEAQGQAGQFSDALASLDDAFAVARKNDEHWYEAEMHRLRGELLLQARGTNGEAEAEGCFRQALETARQQSAKLLELRAALSLHRLAKQQGRGAEESRGLLAEVYGWFKEGFEMPDLARARAALESS